jgi:glucose/arabinose dehydrogenase
MRPRLPRLVALLLACILPAAPWLARADVPKVGPTLIYDQVDFPSTIRFAPDGRLFVLETFSGRVIVYPDSNANFPEVWATLPVMTSGEHGLLGLAFHPQFPDSPFVYLYHTNPDPFANRMVRMRDSAGVGTDYTVLYESPPPWSDTHQSGRLAFGPDRMLYMTVGDQYVPTNSQDLSNPLGKIHRMTSTGKPAPGNPFGPLSTIAAYGVRNSFGLCFDPLTGYGYFTDNGPDCDDEVNFFSIGANYGWGPDDLCGSFPAGTTGPMWMVSPTKAPTGICVYRGRLLNYDGNVLFTTYNDYTLRRMVLRPGHPDIADTVQVLADFPASCLDVTVGPDERIWIATVNAIWRINYVPPLPLAVNSPVVADRWQISPSPFTDRVTLAAAGAAQLRKLDVFDVTGRRVRSFDGPFSSASSWDGRDDSGRSIPAGVYLVRAETTGGPRYRRLVRLAQ